LNFLNIELKKIIFYLLLVILPMLSINAERKGAAAAWYDEPFKWVSGITQTSLSSLNTTIRHTTSLYVDLIGIKKQNNELKSENQELLARNLRTQELETENNRLRALLAFKESTKMELVAAQVIGRDLMPDHRSITINKGTSSGLKPGQAVITTLGAVGYIFRPSAQSSHVMLMTDRYAVIDGLVQRTRSQGIVEGQGSTDAYFKYAENAAEIKVGDIILTGGLDNIFPKGLPLAAVTHLEAKPFAVSAKIELKPFIDPYTIEDVFVIINPKNQDLTDVAHASE
jgi:rod shape-determining protein MreC